VAGRKCFALRADLHILSAAGGLVDAACVAALAALRHFRRPDVEVRGEAVRVFAAAEREPVPLSLLHQPFCVTFSVVEPPDAEGARVVLVDADAAEEQVRGAEVVVCANKHGEVCQVAKYGGVAVEALELLGFTQTAVAQAKMLDAVVSRALEADAKKRDVGGLMAELSAENARIIEPPVG
jgi:exosome complex component RRP45